MKKILLVLAVMLGVISASARDNYSRDVKDLPVAAQTVIKNHFKKEVSHIKIEKEWGCVSEYDVVLVDGSEITFDSRGNWKDIEVKGTGSVPSALILNSISTYVKQNQKKARIIGVEKNRSGYEVELSNGVEMKFNLSGQFLRYD